MDTKLIINADDFGISKGVNRGIAEAHVEGVLNSASLMVNMPETANAISIIRELPKLRVGIHLSLIGGRPVSKETDVSSIVDNNGFFPKRGLHLILRLLFLGKRILDDISKEIRAQIEIMKEARLRMSHIDSHDHIHVFPPIMKLVTQLASEYNIPRVRCPVQRYKYTSIHSIQALKSHMISLLGWYSRRNVKIKELFSTNHMWGMAESGNLTEANLIYILKSLPKGLSEIMCHPGYLDRELLERFPVDYNWETELDALKSPNVKSFIKDNGIQLV